MRVVDYMPDNHPNSAFAVDLDNRRMHLNSGACVPILRYIDDDGDEVSQDDLDLHDEVRVVYGPLPCGLWGVVSICRQQKH